MTDFWTSTRRVRLKPHCCDTCGQTVPKGAVSFDESGKADGDFNSYKQCEACHEIVRYFYWRGTFESGKTWFLFELADAAREEGLSWPPAPLVTAAAIQGSAS